MRLDLRLLAALAMASAFAAPSIAWSGPPSSPPPPAPPSNGGGGVEEPNPGGGASVPGARPNPGERPPPGAALPAPKSPSPPSSPPPPGSNAPAPAQPPEPPAKPVDLSATWGYSKSRPVAPRYTRSEGDLTATAANPSGFYSGVSTGGNHVPPLAPTDFESRPVLMTWTGFERAPEGSRVYFQLNGPVQHEMHQDGLVLKVRMRNTKVNVKNNARRLDMRYFETPVREVRVKRVGKDTEATIELKRAANPTLQLVDGKAGYKLLTVQFDDARAGGGTGRGGTGDDPYKSTGGGGYVGGDTTEPQRTATGAGDSGTAAGGQGTTAEQGTHTGAGTDAAGGPGANAAAATSASAHPDWAPLDLYGVPHD